MQRFGGAITAEPPRDGGALFLLEFDLIAERTPALESVR
jgi:hypothetical protein